MFHVKHEERSPQTSDPDHAQVVLPLAVRDALGLDDYAEGLLRRYAEWLRKEAMPAGGIGPNEVGRVWDRHILDALTFAKAAEPTTPAADVGTGVGLPGIPLAIAHPEIEWTLIDRSGRRTDLAARAVRILRLDNARVIRADITDLSPQYAYVASRAVLQPKQAVQMLPRLLVSSGTAVVALRRGKRPALPVPVDEGVSVETQAVQMLDGLLWFLIMHKIN